MQFFYFPNVPASGIFTLDADESRHCLRVLRKKIGDKIEVVDGKGNLYDTVITDDKNKLCELKVMSRRSDYGRHDFKISIGIAPPKNLERFEWFLEKATEIGVDEVFPFFAERSERIKLNASRFNKILVSAMKQSGKAYRPVLQEPKKFAEMMTEGLKSNARKFIAVCEAHPLSPPQEGRQARVAISHEGGSEGDSSSYTSRPHLKDVYRKGSDALILIGPEGDFSGGEVKLAIDSGFQPVSLGTSRLRVETAGVVACHVVNMINE
jgi:16S rRNA (uracil1498-N3)-methyltransferase